MSHVTRYSILVRLCSPPAALIDSTLGFSRPTLWASLDCLLSSTNSTPEANKRNSEQAHLLALQIPLVCEEASRALTLVYFSPLPKANAYSPGSTALICNNTRVSLKTNEELANCWCWKEHIIALEDLLINCQNALGVFFSKTKSQNPTKILFIYF